MANDKKDIVQINVNGGQFSISDFKKQNFSVESENTKPFDLSLMTGNNSTESEDREQ